MDAIKAADTELGQQQSAHTAQLLADATGFVSTGQRLADLHRE